MPFRDVRTRTTQHESSNLCRCRHQITTLIIGIIIIIIIIIIICIISIVHETQRRRTGSTASRHIFLERNAHVILPQGFRRAARPWSPFRSDVLAT